MKNIHARLILLAGLVLAGCSGGSSSTTAAVSTSTAAKVTIDAANQSTITTAALDSATSQIGGAKSNLTMVGGVQTSSNSTEDRFLTLLANNAIDKFIDIQASPLSVTGAATSITSDCATGQSTTNTTNTMSIVSDGATYANITYNQCTMVSSATYSNYYDGSLSLSGVTTTKAGTAVTGIAATFSFNLTGTSTNNGIVTNQAIVGGFTIKATGINTTSRSDTMAGTSLNVIAGTKYNTLSNFSFSSDYDDTLTTPLSYSDTITYTYASDTIAAAFDFKTLQPLVTYGAEPYPRSGQVVISSSNTIMLTILPSDASSTAGSSNGKVTVEYSTDGGTTWGPATPYTWATL